VSLKRSLAAAVTRVTHAPVGSQGPIPTDAPSDGLPDPFLQLMTRAWRAQPEDTVGGWCITLAEDPRSPSDGALAIAMFLSQDLAVHIAQIHNASLAATDGAPGTGPASTSSRESAPRAQVARR
jgi:hypothetical protein